MLLAGRWGDVVESGWDLQQQRWNSCYIPVNRRIKAVAFGFWAKVKASLKLRQTFWGLDVVGPIPNVFYDLLQDLINLKPGLRYILAVAPGVRRAEDGAGEAPEGP